MNDKNTINNKLDIMTNLAKNIILKLPGLNATTDIIYKFLTDISDLKKQQKLKDIENFILNLRKSNITDITNENFEDIYLVIEKIIQDNDNKKIPYYYLITKNLSTSNYTTNQRKDFILLLSNLAEVDLQLARKFFIYSKNELINNGNIGRQQTKLSNTTDGFTLASLNKLKNNGLIRENKQKDYYLDTNLLSEFITLIFNSDDLTPQSIGEKIPNADINIFIFSQTESEFQINRYFKNEKTDRNINFITNSEETKKNQLELEIKNTQYLVNQIKNYIEKEYKYKCIIAWTDEFIELQNKAKFFINIHTDSGTYIHNGLAVQARRGIQSKENTFNIFLKTPQHQENSFCDYNYVASNSLEECISKLNDFLINYETPQE